MDEVIVGETITAKARPEREAIPQGAWLALFAIFTGALAAPINQFKPSTIAPELIASLNIPLSSYGWIFSVFGILGIFLAIPAAGIVYRLGLKRAFIISLVTTIIGAVVGALAPGFSTLLIGRFIEGCGMGFMGIVAPTAVSLWFPPSRRGFPITVFHSWIPLGALITMNIAPYLAGRFSWHAVWWFGAAYAIFALIIVLAFFKNPGDFGFNVSKPAAGESKASKWVILRNPSLWVLCFAFLTASLVTTGTITSYWSLYLRTAAGIDATTAALAASLSIFPGAISNLPAGWLSDKLRTRKLFMMIGFAVILGFLWFAFSMTSVPVIFVGAVLVGTFMGWAFSMITTSTPEVLTGPDQNALGLGMVNVFRNLGTVIGGAALGYLVEPLGWSLGARIVTIPIIIIAMVLVLVVTRKTLR